MIYEKLRLNGVIYGTTHKQFSKRYIKCDNNDSQKNYY